MKKVVVLLGFIFCFGITAPSMTFAINIDSADIIDGEVMTVDIANDAVTSAKILDGNVTTADIADGAVTDAKILSVSGTKVTGTVANATNADTLDGIDSAEFSKKYKNVFVVAESGGDYTTIQAAIDEITSGPTLIRVMPGQYIEDINIYDKEVYLQGAGSETTELRPATSNGTTITADWGWGYISGFLFGVNGNSKAIDLTNSEITITNNVFRGSGIVVDSSDINVEKNAFHHIENSIYAPTSTSNVGLFIRDNSFLGDRNCSTSIHINNANANVTATNNRFDGIQCAPIYIRDSNSVVLINNYIYGVTNPGGSGSTGIQVEGTNIVIQGNYITNNLNGGIYLTNSQSSSSVLIKDNSITSNGWNGIYLSSLPLGVITISNNQLTGNLPHDINDLSTATSNISFNIFDSCSSTTANANYNVSADGSSTVTCQ